MRALGVALLLAAVGTSQVFAATDEEIRKLKLDMMIHAKQIAIMDYKGKVSAYTSDNDPDTLEIVFLADTSDEPGQVSADGEVIFLNKATTKPETQALINKAFDIRVQRKLAAQPPAP